MHSFKRKSKEVIEYIPTDFLGIENPPTFLLRHLSLTEIAEISDEGIRIDPMTNEIVLCFNAGHYKAGRKAIIGWKNIYDENETELEFKVSDDGSFDESLFEDIDIFNIIVEIGYFITKRDN